VGIAWPLPAGVQPIVAPRDAAAPPLRSIESFP
jgi:hypothetical protein